MAIEAESLSPANLSAARQHVRTLSTPEREALLRALLEQPAILEQPELPERPRTPKTPPPRLRHADLSSSPSASASAPSSASLSPSVIEWPSLPEEVEDDDGTVLSPAQEKARRRRSTSSSMSRSSTITSWPTRSASTSAVSGRLSPRQPLLHTRSLSTSHAAALRSSFSTKPIQTNRITADSVDLFRYGSKPFAYAALLERDSSEELSELSEPDTTINKDTVLHGGLNIVTPADADVVQGPATAENSPRAAAAPAPAPAPAPVIYSCTSCSEKFSRRSAWAAHDVTCRASASASARQSGRSSNSNSKRHPRTQRAWACGFCAAFLGSVERYQDHVAGHFERGKKGLADWHFANVIYGLLHQPHVHKAWKRTWAARAAALPAGQRPKATWPAGCQFPTKRTNSNKPADTRGRSRDGGNGGSGSGSGGDIVYIGLREALESFDAAVESASVIVLHAESLAIFVSVPIDTAERGGGSGGGGSSNKARDDRGGSAGRSRSSGGGGRDRRAEPGAVATTAVRSRSRPYIREKTGLHRATSTTITNISKRRTQSTAAAPALTSTSTSTSTSTTVPVSSPPTAAATARSKDDPLPALPLFATLAASSMSPPAGSASAGSGSGNGNGKHRRVSSKAASLMPLSLFRSKETETGASGTGGAKEKASDKVVAASTSASSPPSALRSAYWADRPLPPLVMDAPSPSSSPDTQAQLVATDHYTLASPSASDMSQTKSVNEKAKVDMERIGTSFVDDFISSISAKRAVRG